jgi:6-pyruvoyltetrahydropterin/6-carboxytetrahydropterin synthase
MEIYKEFTFESAHSLPKLPSGHKCSRIHGHSFRVRLYVKGDVDKSLGWIMDYSDIKEKFEPILDQLDHRYLNEVSGLENPTSENIAVWIWERTKQVLPKLSRVEIKETCTTGCVYP